MGRKGRFTRYSVDVGQSGLGEQFDVQDLIFLVKAAIQGHELVLASGVVGAYRWACLISGNQLEICRVEP